MMIPVSVQRVEAPVIEMAPPLPELPNESAEVSMALAYKKIDSALLELILSKQGLNESVLAKLDQRLGRVEATLARIEQKMN